MIVEPNQWLEISKQLEAFRRLTKPRPIAEYHEDMGSVLWWAWEAEGNGLPGRWLGEPPYVGSPLDLGHTVEAELLLRKHGIQKKTLTRMMVGGWPGYHTHFTPLPPMPEEPK